MKKLKLIYDRQSVGQSVLVSGAHLEPATNFSFSLKFPLDSCGFVILWCPLCREDGSAIYSAIASGPCQSSHSWVKVPQNSRLYFTVSSETPPTWRARSPYLYPPGTGWSSYTPGHWVATWRRMGKGVIQFNHSWPRHQMEVRSASCPGRPFYREGFPGTHWTGGRQAPVLKPGRPVCSPFLYRLS
jgi:hypothetical protein